MNKLIWCAGAPPHVGWWNASNWRIEDTWHWWNGSHWSKPAYKSSYSNEVSAAAQHRRAYQQDMEWTEQWPLNAIRQRLVPPKGVILKPMDYWPWKANHQILVSRELLPEAT